MSADPGRPGAWSVPLLVPLVLLASALGPRAPAAPAARLAASRGVTGASAAPQPSALQAPPGADFATTVFHAPWTFADPGSPGLLFDDGGPAMGIVDPVVRQGSLDFAMRSPGYLSPLWGGYPGALQQGADGVLAANQIDAARFDAFAVRLYSSAAVSAGVFWFSCWGADASCEGGAGFEVAEGWHTYDIALVNAPAFRLPQAWTGRIDGFRLALSPQQETNFRLDWMRLYAAGTGPSVHWTNPHPGSLATLDVVGTAGPGGANPSDTVPGPVPCSARTSCSTTAAAATTDLSFLPPGSYRFWVVSAGQAGPLSAPLTIENPPTPVIDSPDAQGGADYASSVLGHPWNLASADQVARLANVRDVTFGPRGLTATNSGPVENDPSFFLNLAGHTINGLVYHLLTVTMTYHGVFDLANAPGGGTMARFLWERADHPGALIQTRPWVWYTDRASVTYNLDAPEALLNEPDAPNRYSWASSSPITAIGWKANEDPGARTWTVSNIALRATDTSAGVFPITWSDAAATPGSRVRLLAWRAGSSGGPLVIASGLGERASGNTYRWDTAGVPPGVYELGIMVTDGCTSGSARATGPLDVVRPR